MSVKSQTNSNVIVAAFQPGAIDAAVIEAGAQPAVTTKPEPKKDLSNAVRGKAKANAQAAIIGDLVQRIGDEIGHYSADADIAKGQMQATLESLLRDAMQAGLTVEMLKAPTKMNPQECYVALVDAINAPRIGAGLDELKSSVRDNYLSKIRTFLRDRGANPLDLFGNLAKAKAKVAAKDTSEAGEQGEASEAERVTKRTVSFNSKSGDDESLIGLPALKKYLDAWIVANDGKGLRAAHIQMAVDLRDDVKEILGE